MKKPYKRPFVVFTVLAIVMFAALVYNYNHVTFSACQNVNIVNKIQYILIVLLVPYNYLIYNTL